EEIEIGVALHIQMICRRFEADWRAGKNPAIGGYLAEVPEEGRPALRYELETLERELRGAEQDRTNPSPEMLVGAPTIAPASPPPAPIPGTANPYIHEEATVSPRDQATFDLGSSQPARAGAAEPTRVRYFGDYEIIREIARGG